MGTASRDTGDQGVLLFYHLTPLDDPSCEEQWQRAQCECLNLTGRLRIAPQGLNGTLSGSRSTLEEYTRAVCNRFSHAGGHQIDWKLADASADELFPSLSVRQTDEVVSLGVPAAAAPLSAAGEHLSPQSFHERLHSDQSNEAVLLDVRNICECPRRTPCDLLPPVTC